MGRFDRLFGGNAMPTARTAAFGGIVQATDEGDMRVSPECNTHKGVNFWTDTGNLGVRNLYEAVIGDSIPAETGYTYRIKSMFVHAADTPILLAGVEAFAAGQTTVHHGLLIKRRLDMTDSWTEVLGATSRSLGSNARIRFANADFTFVNYSGDFYENGAEVYATILANGVDLPMFYTWEGLSLLKSDGWTNTTANGSAHTLTSVDNVQNGDTVQILSRTMDLPTGLTQYSRYFVVNAGGGTFQVSETYGGSAIAFTGNGVNLMARSVSSTQNWAACTVDFPTGVFTAAINPANGNAIEFGGTSNPVPKGINALQKYYVVNAGGNSFNVAEHTGGPALAVTSNGVNVQVRIVDKRYSDAPILYNIFVHSDRLWGTVGNTLYHNAGYYDDAAHPADWAKFGAAGSIPIPTWDGDTIRVARLLNGRPWVCKEKSAWTILGEHPPYTVRQLFTAKGTIAPKSLAWYSGSLFYAAEEGILAFDGAQTKPFLTTEIQKLWYPSNTGVISNAVGNVLYVFGKYYHPITGMLGDGILAVHLPTKNICYFDMSMGEATLTCQCVLDPWFTTLQPNTDTPRHWFASGDKVYQYSLARPETGDAPPLTYYYPQTDMGGAAYTKDVAWLYVTGCGGQVKITPVVDGTELTANSYTLTLPESTAGVVEQPVWGVTGRLIGWKIENVNGSAVEIRNLEVMFERSRN